MNWGELKFLADPITSLIIVFIIMIQTVPLVRDTTVILMQTPMAYAGVCWRMLTYAGVC
jgi:Co/Zn/Cd efflux system component